MNWQIVFHPAFREEFRGYPLSLRREMTAIIGLLAKFGPQLKRPHADTLNGSDYANMKELRFRADGGVWRVAYAFDPKRQAVLLVAGDKSGGSEKRFYRQLIRKADERFDTYLEQLKED